MRNPEEIQSTIVHAAMEAGRSRRRDVLRQGLALGAAASLGGLAHAQSAPLTGTNTRADPEAARKEGPLVMIHGDQEEDVTKFARAFTERTGVEVRHQRLVSGAALPRLEAEFKANSVSIDVVCASDYGLMELLNKKKYLMHYVPSDIASFRKPLVSPTPGYWTGYYTNLTPIMYDPRRVKPEDAPKTWTDFLDPRWAGQIGMQKGSAGTSFAFWYLLKDILPPDFWTKFAAQKPRGYDSSTQILADMQNGNLLIGGAVSIYQWVKAQKSAVPVNVVFPPEGVPSNTGVVGILAPTKRPNACKLYLEFLLSKEGQALFNGTQGSISPRTDVAVPGLPDLSKVKILAPTNLDDYSSLANRSKYNPLWNKLIGL